jgi:hypothetical protein
MLSLEHEYTMLMHFSTYIYQFWPCFFRDRSITKVEFLDFVSYLFAFTCALQKFELYRYQRLQVISQRVVP